jgi:hypothetical protein
MDESQPLLGQAGEPQYSATTSKLIDFDPNGDPDDPLEWSNGYKARVVCLLALLSFTV